ncbi:hypothetical protein N8T08_010521 [Aspergillus melleus]|uniref:Uncharacterized protein n=1 Tax=Aspergillus melleus TaxID=138277 RepID=A0ACC3ARB6_9EURO|nr:hypothetical protein N8T08_010521 [Aspergillus melleus]
MGGNAMIVKLLLERTTTTRQIDSRDCSGRTPLSYAASSGNASTVECLLEQGEVDPASRDITGRTPLFYATYSGHMAAVKLFLSKPEVDPLSESNIGRSPLSIAAEARYFSINALLIQECKRRGVVVGHVDQPVPTAFAPPHIPHAGCDSLKGLISVKNALQVAHLASIPPINLLSVGL